MAPKLTQTEVRAAMDRCPRELHRLLIWLCTGAAPEALRSRRDGTA